MANGEATAGTLPADHAATHAPSRRDFLTMVTLASAAVAVGAVAWPFVASMGPAADVLAAGAPVDVDLTKLQPGQQIVVLWRGKPIFILHRTPEALKELQSPALLARLADPASGVDQQPPYARNWHRSITPEYGIMVGICTHLGCLPGYYPRPDPANPAPNWPGGYLCPCHGSKYDLAGRVYRGVPAPDNLPVPPYHLVNGTIVRLGENPPGVTFDLSSVVQI
jgi:ubiquinol-cytochrome c reductase iron-sulfur subunit